jgi:membrane protease YdiL (CAAX protease family)
MSEIVMLIIAFLPVFVLLFMANSAEKRRENIEPYQGVATATYLFLALLYGVAILLGIFIQAGASMLGANPDAAEVLQGGSLATGVGLQIESLPLIGLGIWLPSVLGILMLLPPVRRLWARIIPIDSESPVHAVALSLSMLVVVNLLLTLGVGLGNLNSLLAAQEGDGAQANTILSLWAQQILLAAMAMIGVGWLTRRNLPEVLERLGIEWITGRQLLIGIGLGLAMVPVVMGLEYLASLLGLGADPDVEKLTEQLLGPLFRSPFGILTLGVAAAIGEETLFRGALLPRFGLVLSALLFALLHSNYGITMSTLFVFALGVVLGMVRIRHNTTTAMVVHAVYNMTLGILAYLGSSLVDI